ncbi:Uncharacterised protein [Vibrio cholerae]|nr:Uncharacterised protein [Vibrio cholerae]CSI79526.1 Uncharacterised protein [Vibrio cholerae]
MIAKYGTGKYRTEHRQHKCNICSASHVTRNRQHDAKSAP